MRPKVAARQTAAHRRSHGILLVHRCRRRERDPGMAAAVVHGDARRRKPRIGESTDRNAHRAVPSFFGVEQVRPADGTEPEPELRATVARTNVLSSVARHSVRRSKRSQGGKDGTRTALALQAVADADSQRFARHFDAKLAAGTGSDASRHGRVEGGWESRPHRCEHGQPLGLLAGGRFLR